LCEARFGRGVKWRELLIGLDRFEAQSDPKLALLAMSAIIGARMREPASRL
jgi:hypothetical protein